jgi:hypothetical protein
MKDQPFDWDAFMRDTLELSIEATGAWLRCLYKMRLAATRGRLSWPLLTYAKLFGETEEGARLVIDEIADYGVGNLEIEPNGNFTLSNRRMLRQNAKETNGHKPTLDLTALKAKAVYSHINIDSEFEKAETWCEANGRQNTLRFFVNWLNRIQKPLVNRKPQLGTVQPIPEIDPPCKYCGRDDCLSLHTEERDREAA